MNDAWNVNLLNCRCCFEVCYIVFRVRAWIKSMYVSVFLYFIHSVLGNHLWIIMFYIQGLSFSAWNALSRTFKSRNILTFKFTHNSFLFPQIWNKRSYLRLIEILQETADAGINPFWKTPFTLLVRACLSPWLADSSSTHFLTEQSARRDAADRCERTTSRGRAPVLERRCVTRLISEWGDSSACGTLHVQRDVSGIPWILVKILNDWMTFSKSSIIYNLK